MAIEAEPRCPVGSPCPLGRAKYGGRFRLFGGGLKTSQDGPRWPRCRLAAHLELKRRHLGDALDAAPGLYLAPTSDPWAVVVAVAWAGDTALACEAVAKVGVVADLKGLPIGAGAAAAPHASVFGDEVL